jgi:protein-disulfide isomerase
MIYNFIFILTLILSNFAFASSEKVAMLDDPKNYLQVLGTDYVLGDKNAPITIIEYSNFSCPYCAYFHKEFIASIKKKYIDTGKIKWVTRLYVSSGPSLKGSMLARCFGEEKYYAIVDLLYLKQSNWAFNKDSNEFLYNIAMLSGMSDADYNNCIDNKSIEDFLLNQRMIAQKILKVNATPTFFINGKEERFRDIESFDKIISSYDK